VPAVDKTSGNPEDIDESLNDSTINDAKELHMTKTRLLIGLTASLVALAISATPALAQFSGKEGQAKAGGSTVELPGTIIICGEVVSQYVQQGATDDLINTNWGPCKAKGSPEGATTVNCKGIQFESPEKEGTESGKATAKLMEECTFKAPGGCEGKIPSASNQKLGKTALKKEASGVLSVVETTGITVIVNKTCELAGIKSTEGAKLKIPTLKQEGLALI
jgi:hypothetical protein